MRKQMKHLAVSVLGLLLTLPIYAMPEPTPLAEAVAEAIADADIVGNRAERDMNIDARRVEVEGYTLQEGDTVIISKDLKQYLTGEEPSEWVYYVRHVVAKVGGTRFPDGILIAGIISWVPAEQLYLAGAVNKTAASIAQEQKHQQYVDTRSEEFEQKTAEEQADIRKKAEEIHMETVKPVEETPTERPVEEPAEVEEEKPVTGPAHPDEMVIAEEKDTTAERFHFNRFTIGVRGGLASLMHSTENDLGKWTPGFDAVLDLQYAHYWQTKKEHNFGFIIGASVGYSMSSMTTQVRDSFSRATIGGKVDYTVTASEVKEKDGEVVLEVPIMFSMILRQGFFLNVGPRLSMPVYAHYKQNMSEDVSVVAYFPEYDVTVPNEPVTGELTDEQKHQPGKWQASKVNVMLTAELGYEFKLLSGNSVGLGAYANYSVYTLYRNDTSSESLVGVKNPEWNQPAPINVLSATDTYAKGLGYFDFGVKVAYHFNFPKQPK